MPKHKKWSSAKKFEIVLQVLKNDRTLNEVCEHHQVSPSQVHAWKKCLLEEGKDIFDRKPDKASQKALSDLAALKRQQSKLYETIGQLTVERDYVKKSWEKYQDSSDNN